MLRVVCDVHVDSDDRPPACSSSSVFPALLWCVAVSLGGKKMVYNDEDALLNLNVTGFHLCDTSCPSSCFSRIRDRLSRSHFVTVARTDEMSAPMLSCDASSQISYIWIRCSLRLSEMSVQRSDVSSDCWCCSYQGWNRFHRWRFGLIVFVKCKIRMHTKKMKSSFILSRWKKQWARDDVLDEVMLRDIYFFLHQRCVWRYDARGLTIDPTGKIPLVRSWRYDMTPYDCDLRRYAALLSYGERFRDVWRHERDCWHSLRSSMCHLRVPWVRERRWLSAHGWMLGVWLFCCCVSQLRSFLLITTCPFG